MKWYFGVSEASLDRPGHGWRNLIRGAAASAARNTSLVPHMLYDGRPNDFTAELGDLGVRVIPHRVSFHDRLEERGKREQGWLPIASGAFLRTEIPLIETEDDIVLYTDADVLFLRDPRFPPAIPALFAVAPDRIIGDYADMNPGVMLINVPAMRAAFPAFRDSILAHLDIGFGQANYRLFFKNRYAALDPTLNWKPHWGVNPKAQIIHWRGPKPAAVKALLADPSVAASATWERLFRPNAASYAHYASQWELLAGRDATEPASSVRCVLDQVKGRLARGWATDRAAPGAIVRMEVLIDGAAIGEIDCGIVRHDVRDAGHSLESGFEFTLPPFYADGRIHRLQFRDGVGRIVEIEHRRDRFGCYEFTLAAHANAAAPIILETIASRRLVGYIDEIAAGGVVQGWAFDRSAPLNALTLALLIDGTPAGAFVCDLHRPDLSATGAHPTGKVGFRCEIPAVWLDRKPHVLEVLFPDGAKVPQLQPDGPERTRLPFEEGPRDGGDGHAFVQPPAPDAEAIRFHLDAPACRDGFAIETVRGFLSLAGWAFGRDGIDRIEVFVDGVGAGRAHHGVRREDLQAAFPDYDALRAGFAMMLPPQIMKKGVRAVRLEIHDKAGRIKEVSFSVRAEAAAAGPGPWNVRTKLPQAEIDLLRAILRARGPAPRWSVLMVVDDASPATRAALAVTLDSLRWQALEDWSAVLLAPSADAIPALAAAIDADLESRLTILPPQPDRALADLAADLLCLIAPGDALGEDALIELAIAAGQRPSADFLYGDERRIDPADGAEKAFFKPDFSPDLLLSTNYVGRVWAASPALLARAGLTEADLRTHGAYDAALRLTELATKVGHVPKVLCVRGPQGEPPQREKTALRRAMRRRGIDGALRPGPARGTWRLQRAIAASSARAKISIVIPTIAARGFIRTAIDSIRGCTVWPDYEIVCLDNISRQGTPEQLAWKTWIAANADRTVEIGEKFNWSRFNNRGARAASGEFLLFLNDDIEVRDPHWLHGLVEHAQRPEVGVVGPQLLYPDGRVQHAGMFLARRAARHAFRFYPADEPGPFGLARLQRDVISVTGACMLMRRDVFAAMRGFDEAHAVINNDLDFCLRVREAGFSVVYAPAVSLTHHEMVSRAELTDAHDSKAFAERWGNLFAKGDPFFSRWLSPDADDHQPDSEPVRPFAAGHPLIARDKIRKILALKLDHIGDFITAFPVFRRLKQRFPGAELTVLCASASLSLAALEPAIDRVEKFDFFHARSEKGRLAETKQAKQALAALCEKLAGEKFDLAIDLRRQADTRPILQAVPARWRAGFDAGNAHPWLDVAVAFEGDIAMHRKRAHVADSLFGLVDAVSAQCETDRDVIVDPAQRGAARLALTGLLPPATDVSGKSLVCLHTGAGALNKQWPAASFAALIDLLIGEANATAILIGGPDEAEFAKKVIGLARRRSGIVSLVGRTKLRELPALLRGADLYVGNDSGPKHVAAAVGVPTIGIHSGTVDAAEWGGMGPNVLSIRRDMSCSPCYLAFAADCHRGLACLDGIRVGDVFAECLRMMGSTLCASAQATRHAAAKTPSNSPNMSRSVAADTLVWLAQTVKNAPSASAWMSTSE